MVAAITKIKQTTTNISQLIKKIVNKKTFKGSLLHGRGKTGWIPWKGRKKITEKQALLDSGTVIMP